MPKLSQELFHPVRLSQEEVGKNKMGGLLYNALWIAKFCSMSDKDKGKWYLIKSVTWLVPV